MKQYQTTKEEDIILKQAGKLVRHSTCPHVPIWVEGADYPAQYLIRQTRSMTARLTTLDKQVLLVSIPLNLISITKPVLLLPKLHTPVEELDFFLPDDIFLHHKLQKLQDIQSGIGKKNLSVNKTVLNTEAPLIDQQLLQGKLFMNSS